LCLFVGLSDSAFLGNHQIVQSFVVGRANAFLGRAALLFSSHQRKLVPLIHEGDGI
jgi:hypothetical protein